MRRGTHAAARTSLAAMRTTHAMPMDYFVWLIRNADRGFVVDTGFTAEMAAKRKRDFLRTPAQGLALLGVDAATTRDVIITHLHYDHVGTFGDFAQAQFHLQDDEMCYATGRHMRHGRFNHGYEAEDVAGMVRLVFKDRVTFHKGTSELAPGVTLHHIGGHTAGLQCVRVMTQRGWSCSHRMRATTTSTWSRPVFPNHLSRRRHAGRLQHITATG